MFAATIGDHLFGMFLLFLLFVWLASRIFATVDDDGQVKKAADEGLAAWISRWMK